MTMDGTWCATQRVDFARGRLARAERARARRGRAGNGGSGRAPRGFASRDERALGGTRLLARRGGAPWAWCGSQKLLGTLRGRARFRRENVRERNVTPEARRDRPRASRRGGSSRPTRGETAVRLPRVGPRPHRPGGGATPAFHSRHFFDVRSMTKRTKVREFFESRKARAHRALEPRERGAVRARADRRDRREDVSPVWRVVSASSTL